MAFSSIFRTFCIGLGFIGLSGCSLLGIRTAPAPDFTVVKKDGDTELRRYKSMVVAYVDVKGNYKDAGQTAFKPLFDYISGANKEQSKIPMTAPVLAAENLTSDDESELEEGTSIPMTAPVVGQETSTGWQYHFVLPSALTLDSAPQPTNAQVQLKSIPERYMAVIEYAGLQSEGKRYKKTAALLDWLETSQLSVISTPLIATYDPPWTIPFLRHNEIMIEVDYAGEE